MKTRINVLFPVFIGILLIFGSCQKKDEITMIDRVAGKWTVSDIQFELSVGDMSLAEYLEKAYGLTEEEALAAEESNENDFRDAWMGTMEFRADGNYVFDVGGGHYESYFVMDKNDSTLHVFMQDHYMEMDILSVSDHQLNLHWDQLYYQDLDGDNNKEAIDYSSYFTLEK
jgi:hypothetical protein